MLLLQAVNDYLPSCETAWEVFAVMNSGNIIARTITWTNIRIQLRARKTRQQAIQYGQVKMCQI
jgi:hypothetical protein